MSYSAATFYVDHVNGSNTARTALTSCTAGNPSGTITRITKAGHGLVTGAVVDLTAFSTWLNEAWKITVVDADNFDLDGAVWQTTADTSGTVTPRGGSSWSDAWATITGGATSARTQGLDVIKVAKSPAPVSAGTTALWTNGPSTDAQKSISSSTNASPIVITINSHGYVTDDVIHVYNHTTNTAANGVWPITRIDDNTFSLNGSTGNGTGGASGYARRINARTVVLTTAQTNTVDNCDSTYTAANSGVVGTTTARQGTYACKVGVPSSGVAVSTKYAYKTLASALDLSSYQELTLCLQSSSASMLATWWKICLCSDTSGNTVVDEFYLPAIGAAGAWRQIVVTRNGGGNLGSSIQSIAFYSNSVAPTASTYLFVDNISASKSDGLNLTKLISKNSSEQFDGEPWFAIQSIDDKIVLLDWTASNVISSSTTSCAYVGTTETVALYMRDTIKLGATEYLYKSGASYLGGYNTSTGLCDGETILDGIYGTMTGIQFNSTQYYDIMLSHFTLTRYSTGFALNGRRHKAYHIAAMCCAKGLYGIAKDCSVQLDYSVFNYYYGIHDYSTLGGYNKYKDALLYGNATNDLYPECETTYLFNIKMVGANPIATLPVLAYGDAHVYSERHGDTDDSHKIYCYGGYIASDAATRHTASGIAWAMYVTDTTSRILTDAPLRFKVARIACAANKLVTVTIYMKKSHATDIGGRLVCPGGQIAGVDDDVVATKASDTDWEQLTIQFTPTGAGIVEIYAYAYWIANTTDENVWVDDMTWTQAA